MPDRFTVTLIIEDTADGGYRADVRHDGEPLQSDLTVSPDDADDLDQLSASYLDLFEGSPQDDVEEEQLRGIGHTLFDTWLSEAWEELNVRPGSPLTLIVASDESAVLNLPWELVVLPDRRQEIGLDPQVSLRRYPRLNLLPEGGDDRRPGPIRILYSACQPREEATLDYEQEEYELMRILSRAGGAQDRVAQFGCVLGSFEELRRRVNQFEPHVVHLTGHAAVQGDEESVFLFEDERGYRDPVSGRELALDALAESNVQCVFVSGCQTGQAPDVDAVGGICQGLVNAGIPNAVGWAASIGDEIAISFAERFYKVLAAGSPVDRALVQARREIQSFWEDRGDPSWTLPVLYSSSKQTDLFDPTKEEQPPPIRTNRDPLPGMPEGHAEHLVGRRREIQRFLPDLRDGDLRVLLLAGLGGVGKSTLATRLARSLKDEGFRPIAVSGATSAAEIINECRDVFRAEGLDEADERLGNEERDPWDRLRDLIRVLNDHSFVLVLDDYETLMDPDDRETKNDLIRRFVDRLTTHLTEASRCIITSRYLLDEFDDSRSGVRSETLEELLPSAFFKFLLADEEVERRIENRDLSYDLLGDIHDLFGGTPGFLNQIRKVLSQEDANALKEDLEAVTLPDTDDEGALHEARNEYLEELFANRLYQSLPEPSRHALSRAAVYTIPMTVEGYAAAAGVEESTMETYVRQWQDRAFVYPESNEETDVERWSVYRLLRVWLLDQIDEEKRRAAHAAAGEWLDGLREADRQEEHLGAHFLDVDAEARSRFLDAENHERAREITGRISGVLDRHAFYDEVARLNEEMLGRDQHPSSMNWLGQVYLKRGEYEEARAELERARDSFRELGDRFGEATARHNLATIMLNQGDYEKARVEFEEVLQIRQEIGDRTGEATTRQQLATIAAKQGDYEAARAEFDEAQQTYQEIEDWRGEVRTRHNLATIAAEQGDYEKARSELEEALQIRQQIGDRSGEAKTRHNLASIALLERRDDEEARAGFEDALEIFREIGDRSWEATTRHQLATIALNQGDYEEARAGFEDALEIFREIGDRSGEAKARHQLASITLNQEGYEAARAEFEEVLLLRQEIGDRSGEATTFGQLGYLANTVDKREKALRFYLHAFRIHREIGHRHQGTAWNHVAALAAELELSEEELKEITQEAAESYAEDRGWGLIQEAFPDADHPDDVPPTTD